MPTLNGQPSASSLWTDGRCSLSTMLGLRDSLSRPLHADGNPWDDGPLPDFTSGLMWTATGLFGTAALALPGSDHRHVVLALALGLFAVGWGVVSIGMAARGHGMAL